ncbi:hypothetical protein FBF24_01250 [Candidatus Saccharibacteria bacterium oral taxon 488]|nr:hypothetical protein FBF24_01250 [Candidatus Saccharibacteria bacterium oral taxon 488]
MSKNRASSCAESGYFMYPAESATDEVPNPYPPYIIDNRLYSIIDAQRSPGQMEHLLAQWPLLFERGIFFDNPMPYLQNLTNELTDPATPYEQTRLVSGLLLEEQLSNTPKPQCDQPATYIERIRDINIKYILAATEALCSIQNLFNETNPKCNSELTDDARRELFHKIQQQIANFWEQFPRQDTSQPTITSTILDMHTHVVTHDLALFSNEPSDPEENIEAKISAIKGLQVVERDIEYIMKQSQQNGVSGRLCSFHNHVRYFYYLYAKEIGFDPEAGRLIQPDTELGKTAVATVVTSPQSPRPPKFLVTTPRHAA